MKLKSKKGFTLVELLVVIAIIGILAVVAVPALFKNINKAKVADLEADYNAIKSAVLSYYTDHNKVPDVLTGNPDDKTTDKVDESTFDLDDYMDSVPTKPSVGESYAIKEPTKHGLLLKVEKATLTKDQVEKLTNDIGVDKLFSGEEDEEYVELKEPINNANLYIVLINNVNM